MTTSNVRLIWNSPDYSPCLETTLEALESGARETWAAESGTGSASAHSRLVGEQARHVVARQLGTPGQNVRNTTDFLGTVHHLRAVFGPRQWFTSTTERLETTAALAADAALQVDADGVLAGSCDELLSHLTEHQEPAALWLSLANPEIGTTQSVSSLASKLSKLNIPVVIDATTALSRPQNKTLPTNVADVVVTRSGPWGDPLDSVFVAFGQSALAKNAQTNFDRRYTPARTIHTLSAAVSMQAAIQQSQEHYTGWFEAIHTLRTSLAAIPGADIAGHPQSRVPHILTASFLYCPGELLMNRLHDQGLEVGSGSACASQQDSPSHVLTACGRLTQGNLRIVLPLTATTSQLHEHIPHAAALINTTVTQVRQELGAEDLL